MDYTKHIPVAVIVVFAIGGFLGWYSPTVNVSANVPAQVGASYDPTRFENPINFLDDVTFGDASTDTVKIGSSGTAASRLNFGTCYIKAYAATIEATSTATVDCQGTAAVDASGISALTGVTFGDQVSLTISTTTAGTTVNGLSVSAAAASTTAGYITAQIYNGTGGTFTWPVTGVATGTASYIAIDN